MPSRHYGYGGFDDPDPTISPRQWDKLEKEGRILFDQETRRQVESDLQTFARRSRSVAEGPPTPLVLQILTALEDTGSDLLAALDELERPSRHRVLAAAKKIGQSGAEADSVAQQVGQAANRALNRELRRSQRRGEGIQGDPPMRNDSIDAAGWQRRIYADVQMLMEAASRAAKGVNATGAVAKNDEFRHFLDRVGPIYESCGGTATANQEDTGRWSPFVRWIFALLDCASAPGSPETMKATGAAIRLWRVSRRRQDG